MAHGPDALEAWQAAELQARRLAPEHVAPQFLAEAIWLRTIAVGAPTDAEVVDYVARCAADHRPVSGRPELEPGIAPVEIYEHPDLEQCIVVRGGRSDYRAQIVIAAHARTGRTDVVTWHGAKSRAKAHRKVEALYPGGRWSSRLLSSEVERIRERWGLASDAGTP